MGAGLSRFNTPAKTAGGGSFPWLLPWAGAGSLCACGGASGPAVKPAVASGQKAGPHPHQFFVSQLGPALRAPPPPTLGCWLPGGPGPHSGGALRAQWTALGVLPGPGPPAHLGSDLVAALAGLQVHNLPHGCGADAGLGGAGAGADAANCGGEGGGEARSLRPRGASI